MDSRRKRAYCATRLGWESCFLHLKFTTRKRLLASLALVFCLLCGAAEPLQSSFQEQSGPSPQRDSVVAPRPFAAVSLGRPAKAKSGITFRKSRAKALAPDKSSGATLQTSSGLSITCHVRHLAADVALGFGRSPPSLSLRRIQKTPEIRRLAR